MAKITKEGLIQTTAKKTGETQTLVKKVTDTYIDVIKEEVTNGNEVEVGGFGKFTNKVTPAREGRNPSTGATIQIPEKVGVKFKIGAKFKRQVNHVPEPEKKPETKKEK